MKFGHFNLTGYYNFIFPLLSVPFYLDIRPNLHISNYFAFLKHKWPILLENKWDLWEAWATGQTSPMTTGPEQWQSTIVAAMQWRWQHPVFDTKHVITATTSPVKFQNRINRHRMVPLFIKPEQLWLWQLLTLNMQTIQKHHTLHYVLFETIVTSCVKFSWLRGYGTMRKYSYSREKVSWSIVLFYHHHDSWSDSYTWSFI